MLNEWILPVGGASEVERLLSMGPTQSSFARGCFINTVVISLGKAISAKLLELNKKSNPLKDKFSLIYDYFSHINYKFQSRFATRPGDQVVPDPNGNPHIN